MEQGDSIKRRRAIWTFSSAVASLLLIQFVVRKYYTPEFFVFDPFTALFYFGLFILTYLSIAISVLWKWKKGVGHSLRLPVIFLLITTTVTALFMSMAKRRSEVPIVFSAYYDGDYNGTGIKLRTDGTFEAIDGSTLGGDIIYGEYRLSGDTITLGKEHFRFGDAQWRFGKHLLITDTGVVCSFDATGKDRQTFVMRITDDDRASSNDN